MLALTSCSTTGSMQNMRNMPVSPNVTHTQQVHVKHKIHKPHHTVTHTKQAVSASVAMPHKKKIVSIKPKPVSVQPVVALQPAKKQMVQAKPVQVQHTVQMQQTPVKPAKMKPVNMKPLSYKKAPPPIGSSIVMSAKSIDLHPRVYKRIGKREEIIANLRNLDNVYGQYHTIQVIRWDGSTPNQTIINAKRAILETIIGLSLVENSIIKSNFGPLIVLLGGEAYIINLRGDPYEMILIKGQPAKSPAPVVSKPKHKRTSLHHGFPYAHIRNVVLTDFYITETNGVIGVSTTKH